MRKPPTFGVLSPFVGGDYYGAIISAINRAAALDGNRILAVQTLAPGSQSADDSGVPALPLMVGWRSWDAVIVLPGAVAGSYVRDIQRAGKPIVLVAHRLPEIECAVVLTDNRVGVRAAVAHLVEHGHERIAFAGHLGAFDCRERWDGYREALAAHGITARPDFVIDALDNHEAAGVRVADALIESGMPATAIVMGTDRNAIGLMHRMTAAGYEVPRDLAVVGFDDIVDTWYSRPSLSTVAQRLDRIGEAAYRLARDEAAGGPPQWGVHHTATEFVRRRSCGCPMAGLQLSEDQMRAQFAHSNYLQGTLNVQYELGMELLGTQDGDVRGLTWLRRTSALGGCLGLWPGAEPRTGAAAADRRIDVVGQYCADRDPPGSVGVSVPVNEFPPPWLFELADGLAGDAVLVVPLRNASRDWGLLATVARIQDSTPPGREMMNHCGSLLVAALERAEMQQSLRDKEAVAIASARYAGMAEIAIEVLHNVGNILNSVNVSCAMLQQVVGESRVAGLAQAAALLEEHVRASPGELASFLTEDPRGKVLPAYLVQLTQVLQRENRDARAEISHLREQVDLIERVLAAQRAHTERPLVRQLADLSQIVDGVLASHADAFAGSQIDVVKDYRPVEPVLVHRTKLAQVIDHLLKNAEEALGERAEGGRQLTIEIGRDAAGSALLKIEDNGEGIAPENLIRIFGLGFTTRLDRPGFGLHYCANSMAQMGGRIAVESDGPGQGAAFLLVFGRSTERA